MKKKIIQLLVFLVGAGLIVKLTQDIWRLLKAGGQVKLAQEKVTELEKEQQELLEKKKYFQSPEFVEEEARNKLNMAKPGEAVVVLPPNLDQVLGKSQPQENPPIPVWRQWWNLFF